MEHPSSDGWSIHNPLSTVLQACSVPSSTGEFWEVLQASCSLCCQWGCADKKSSRFLCRKKNSFSERQARAQQLQQHAVLGAESLLPPRRMLATVARAFLGLPWLQPGDERSLLGRGLPAALRTAEPLSADPRKTSATTLQPPHATATLPQERMQITPFFVVFLVLKTGHYLMTVWSTICYYTATLLPLRHSKGCSWQDL